MKNKKREWLRAIPIDIEKLYEAADEPLPHSAKRWWWCWGGIVGLLFVLQIVTGLLLAMYYRAEPETAYQSVKFMTEYARFGWFIRSVHQWGATFMIIFLFLHVIRVFFTCSFRDYRWGAWMVGVCLLGMTLGIGFTGYSLVYEQMSYWAITVTSNIIATVPVLGETFKRLFLAGNDINTATLSRMYALHVQIIPVLIIFLGAAHLFFVRLMGLYQPGNEKDRDAEKALIENKGYYHFFPDHLLSEVSIFLYILLIIIMLSIILPAKMGVPADPLVTPEHIKPEWYFYPFFHMLKLVPGIAGVMIMSLLGLVLFLYPIIDHYILQKIDRILKIKVEIGTIIGISVIIIYLAWAVVEAKI